MSSHATFTPNKTSTERRIASARSGMSEIPSPDSTPGAMATAANETRQIVWLVDQRRQAHEAGKGEVSVTP
jgi:hypothetical protein